MNTINIRYIQEHISPTDDSLVALKQMGENISEIRYNTRNQGGIIKKISALEYIDTRTGDVKQYEHTAETRADNLSSVARAMRDLREIINTNVSDTPERCLWVTLTYAENMCDPERLYHDMEKFTKRLRYYLKTHSLPTMDFVYCIEPQARGAFHSHCLIIFDSDKAPFIHNDDIAQNWRHGFTKTKSLIGISNPGLYLTAYLTDMDYRQAVETGNTKGKLKGVSVTDENGEPVTKAIIKGSRLHLYPAGMRIFRASRGIKRPVITKCTEAEAMQIIGNAPLTYEYTKQVSDEFGSILNTINYRQYNKGMKEGDIHE